MILILVALSFVIDFYILRRYLWRPKWRKVGLGYAIWAVLLNVSVIALIIVYKYAITSPSFMHFVVWLIFVFMISFISRVIFSLFSLFGLALHAVWREREFRFFTYMGGAGALAVIGAMSYGAVIGRTELRVENVAIYSPRLPAAFEGMRIAQFSDVHLGNWGDNHSVIERMVDKINELNPDIVVQSGDLVNVVDEELTPQIGAILSGIQAPVYAVLGNHDLGFYVYDTISHNPERIVRELIRKQRAMGWTVLCNENRWIHHRGDSIMIAGVSYPNNISHNGYQSSAGGSDLRRAMQTLGGDQFSILISHSPQLFDSVPALAHPDLTLCGHVHAMQAKFQIGKWRFSPASLLYPMYSGLYVDRGHYLYVNDGIGFVLYPMRIGAKPEITIFTLHCSDPMKGGGGEKVKTN
ncbi:MAG: metallophosphoesterase family protein [Mucinivorans sp.]